MEDKDYEHIKFYTVWACTVTLSLLFWIMVFWACSQIAHAEVYDSEEIATAIWHAEGGDSARSPFGILSVHCEGYEDCKKVCLNTIENNFTRWQVWGHKTHPEFLPFLASRYAPVGAENDRNNLNKNWLNNVRYFLSKGDR